MPLSIKDHEADAYARELAAMTHTSITQVVVEALKEKLGRERRVMPKRTLKKRQKQCSPCRWAQFWRLLCVCLGQGIPCAAIVQGEEIALPTSPRRCLNPHPAAHSRVISHIRR
jgi:hypothetical protein